MSDVNSIRPVGGASLRARCEARPVAHASRRGAPRGVGRPTGQRPCAERTVNERKAAAPPTGGWRQNGRKRERGKQGDLPGTERGSGPEGSKSRPAGGRAS